MEYTVVKGDTRGGPVEEKLKEFIQKVNQLLSQGWEPVGGICHTSINGSGISYFSQALIKK